MQIKALAFLVAASLATAQSPDPGVTPTRLMDRPEIRISRVEVLPGAVRSTHTHDDVKFHVWLALTGKLEVTIGSAKPVLATEGQAFFMQKGTPHGFRNVGTTPAAAMEIFVKEGPPAKSLVAGNKPAAVNSIDGVNKIDIEALIAALRN